jgi:CBS domain-containing protein
VAVTARLVMDPNPPVLRDTDLIKTAADAIMTGRYRRLPVVNAAGRYLGMFGVDCLLGMMLPRAILMEDGESLSHIPRESLSDLHRRFQEVENQPISVCSIEETVIVHPDTHLIQTLFTLYRHRINLPVVDAESGRLEGLISYWSVGAAILAAEI